MIAGSSKPDDPREMRRPRRRSRPRPGGRRRARAASRATSRVSRPGRFGSGRRGRRPGVVHRADDTRLARCADGSPSSGRHPSWPRSSGPSRSSTIPAGITTWPRPTRPLVVVQRDERRAVTAYRWGLIPHWATEARVGSRMFNARAETITSSPAFRDAFVRKRCLVPVDSFYEWKREGTIRQPYRVVRRDGRPLALAGLWAGWQRPGDRHGPAHVHDRDDHAERGDRGPARPDAGRRRRGRLGPLARPGAGRSRRAARAARAERGRSSSTSTPSTGTSTTCGATARS